MKKKIIFYILFIFNSLISNENILRLFNNNDDFLDKKEKGHQHESELLPLEIIKNYQKFILLNFSNLKEKIEEIRNIIKKINDHNKDKLKIYKYFLDILVELNLKKDRFQKLIYSYEYIIDFILKERLASENRNFEENFDFENIIKYSIQLYYYNKTLKNLFNDLNNININNENINNENEDILNEFYSHNIYHKLIEEINHYKKILILTNKNIKEIETKIIENKKIIIEDKIKSLKNFFNKIKRINNINDKKLLTLIDSEKKTLDLLLEKKYEKIKEKDDLEKSINLYVSSNNLNFNNLEIENVLDELSSTVDIEKKINFKEFNILEKILKKELLLKEINIINIETHIINNNIDFIEGWKIIFSKNSSVKTINNFIHKINSFDIKDYIEEVLKEKNKILELNSSIKNCKEFLEKNINKFELKNDFIDQFVENESKNLYKIINLYDQNIENIKKILAINFILQEELKIKNFWCRSEYSINISEFKNFLPNIKDFIISFKDGFFPFIKESYYFFTLQSNTLESIHLLYMIIGIILVFIIGLFFKSGLNTLNNYLIKLSLESTLAARINLFLSFIIEFGYIIYFWFAFFILFKIKIIPSSYAYTLFCIFSSPFLFYFFNLFFNWFENINKQKNFIFISSDYVYRFISIIKIFINFSILLFLFKESFISLERKHSSIIIILNAIQFILVQILLIRLIKKDKIIQSIPDKNNFGLWLKDIINNYYNIFLFFLISIITISNPYVGYGAQVFYFSTRTLITFIAILLIKKIFEFLRDKSIFILFKSVDGDIQNKIPAGKIIYLIFNSGLILFLYFFAIFFLFKIYDFNLNLDNFIGFFYKNLLSYNEINNDKITSMALIDIAKVIAFIIFGYFVSFCIENLFISKILNPSIVGHSLKNTIITIVKYIIVCCMFIIGLYSAGLQSITTKLAVIIGFLGFAIKEPFADFFSYFIILVQRPIKIGDFIRINMTGNADSDIVGVVRHITPRTTLVRQRNSQTVIVPNSIIISRLISNWNFYKTGFVAIDDIIISIDFMNDPEVVRLILIKIVESHSLVLKNPSPIVRCEKITTLGLDFLVRAYIMVDRAHDQFDIASQIRLLIIKKLKEENIKLAVVNYKITLDK